MYVTEADAHEVHVEIEVGLQLEGAAKTVSRGEVRSGVDVEVAVARSVVAGIEVEVALSTDIVPDDMKEDICATRLIVN